LSRNVRADAKDLSLILKMIITPTSLLDDPALNKTFETLVLIGKISISFKVSFIQFYLFVMASISLAL